MDQVDQIDAEEARVVEEDVDGAHRADGPHHDEGEACIQVITQRTLDSFLSV